jgi:hypothetical protein
MFFLFVAGSMHSSTHKTYNVLVDVYIVLCNSKKTDKHSSYSDSLKCTHW